MVCLNRVFYSITLLSVVYSGLIKNENPMQKPVSLIEQQKLKGQEFMLGAKRKQKEISKRSVGSLGYPATIDENKQDKHNNKLEVDDVAGEPFESTIADIIGEGEEKWALFLSTSDDKKFKRLIKYLKSSIELGREESIATSLTDKAKQDHLAEKAKEIQHKNQFKFTSDTSSHDLATLEQLNDFFSGVTTYMDTQPLEDMVENTANYESSNLMKYENIEIQENAVQSLSNKDIEPEELLWLKDNVLRRSLIIQHLLSGELENSEVEMDEIRYREGNLFLEPDDNEFIFSAGASSQKFNDKFTLALLVIFTELSFFLL